MSERERAYHEAGHAVIGRVLKLVCGSASIEEDHDSAGHAITAEGYKSMQEWDKQAWDMLQKGQYRRIPDYDAAWRARIIAYMAGAEAERAFDFVPTGDEDDRQQINRMLTQLDPSWSDEEYERYEKRLRSKTRGLVRRHRQSIESVAKALLEHKTLQDDQIYERINRAADD
jgi:ATP-dependent Zn protease